MTYQINSEKILFTQLGDEGVVYNIEKNEYITLNETLFRILQGVEQNKTTPEIVGLLCQDYNISETDCMAEVEDALKKLEKKTYISAIS